MKFDKEDLKLGKIEGKGRKAATPLVRSGAVHKDKSKFDKSKERQTDRKLSCSVHENVLTNVRLNDNQKAILANLITRQEPTTLVDLTSNIEDKDRQNITTNIKLLQKLGLLDVSNDQTIKITDKGQQIAKDNNITDETGGISPDGEKAKSMFQRDDQDSTDQANAEMGQSAFGEVPAEFGGPEGQQTPTTEVPVGNAPMPGMGDEEEKPFGESFSLFKQIMEDVDFKQQVQAINTKYAVYKASGPNTDKVYYGFCQGGTLADAKKSFFNEKDREESRGVVQLIQDNNGDEGTIDFDIEEEVDNIKLAFLRRNEYRELDSSQSITGPSYFPAKLWMQAKAEYPEEINRMNQAKEHRRAAAYLAQHGIATASKAYSMGLFKQEDMMRILKNPETQKQVNGDKASMSPLDFAKKYSLQLNIPKR